MALAACSDAQEPHLDHDAPEAASAPGKDAAASVITLLTGDRVTLRPVAGSRPMVHVEHGPGRDHVAFSVRWHRDELSVIPEDVAGLIGAGRLDRGLFNVTRLLADGMGDDRRDDLPLLLTGDASVTASHGLVAGAGLAVDRSLPALHVVALRQPKASPGAALAALGVTQAAGSAPLRAAGAAAGSKLWLDRQRQVFLDRSVPQIGAPAAYARGLSGAGVTVAVLDTGIDAAHPDLVGKVVAAASFVDDGNGTADLFGHGTHVASIVAGSGAASGGQYHGVAPSATLLNGRVCDEFGGCPDSAILAGMEWAVDHGARIVNMSLGGFDDASLDPLEEAVNRLSAERGTLFVIAAGNLGFGPRSVSSPSSADAALSVGAVDSFDQRAPFSGQGPRAGDGAVKPDVMAPGVGIVAARAADTQLGAPIEQDYVRLSGTSMATPHVAGVAALLLQQHPDWTGEQLKEALMGSAQPGEGQTVYEQGAGRVDADRATAQDVRAEPASLNFGTAAFPHDDDEPIVRTVRYHNASGEAITLALATALTSRQGDPAPEGMITVAPTSLSVPAGGTADVLVTIDTRVAGPEGSYGGTLVASNAGVRVITPLAVEREPESYNLTVSVVRKDGQPDEASLDLWGVGELGSPIADVFLSTHVPGEATLRLPAGTYALVELGEAFLVAPRISLTSDRTVAMDARLARPQRLTLPDAELERQLGSIDFEDVAMTQGVALISPEPLDTAQLGPAPAPGEVHTILTALYARSTSPSPVVYHLAHVERDRFPTGWQRTFLRREFARVDASHAAPQGRLIDKIYSAFPPVDGFFFGAALPAADGPFQRTEYYYGPDFRWYTGVFEGLPLPNIPGAVLALAGNDSLTEYVAGRSYRESWNKGPLGPAFAGASLAGFLDLTGSPKRFGSFLLLAPSMFSDEATPARHSFSVLEAANVKLFRNDELLTSGDGLQVFTAIPEERSQYRLEVTATRPAELFDRSTQVSASWTFHAQAAAGLEVLPLPSLRFLPPLDERTRTAVRTLVMPMRIERPQGAAAPELASLRVDASFDDGATWARVPSLRLGAHAWALITHPPGATHVALRGAVVDVEGNAVEQTIVRAYALPGR
ncbi:MAG: S8 family peptidase [Kofleriaceae bacterium]